MNTIYLVNCFFWGIYSLACQKLTVRTGSMIMIMIMVLATFFNSELQPRYCKNNDLKSFHLENFQTKGIMDHVQCMNVWMYEWHFCYVLWYNVLWMLQYFLVHHYKYGLRFSTLDHGSWFKAWHFGSWYGTTVHVIALYVYRQYVSWYESVIWHANIKQSIYAGEKN